MYSGLKRSILVGTVGASVLGLAACGVTSGASHGAPAGSGGTTMEQQASPSAAAADAAASQNTPGASASGTVALTLDKQHFAPGEAITITIANGGSATIWAADHQTNCGVLVVERQANGGWQQVARCLSMRATRLVPFQGGGRTQTQFLGGQTSGSGGTWPAGTYRAALTYTNGEEAAQTGGATVYSATFTIG